MTVKTAAALSIGDQITHDGTNRLVKPLVIRSIANDEVRVDSNKSKRGYDPEAVASVVDAPMLSLNGSHIIVNDSITFHKSWEVTVK